MAYIVAKRSQLQFLKNLPLYYQPHEGGDFSPYKAKGETLSDERIQDRRLPVLFFHSKYRRRVIGEIQNGLNAQLKEDLESGDVIRVKDTIVTIVRESFEESIGGGLSGLSSTVETLVEGYIDQPAVLKNLASLSFRDYSLSINSINVMTLTLFQCLDSKVPLRGEERQKKRQEAKSYGLAALLRNVGITRVDDEGRPKVGDDIVRAQEPLSDEQFEILKQHPEDGHSMLVEDGIDDGVVLQGVLEHHERIDGSGYPSGKAQISRIAQVIGIIDSYEALIHDDRPYRGAMKKINAMKLIKREVDNGAFDREIFNGFLLSLGPKR